MPFPVTNETPHLLPALQDLLCVLLPQLSLCAQQQPELAWLSGATTGEHTSFTLP